MLEVGQKAKRSTRTTGVEALNCIVRVMLDLTNNDALGMSEVNALMALFRSPQTEECKRMSSALL
jgi:hypothetical protein